jgi:CBS domain-containing protein
LTTECPNGHRVRGDVGWLNRKVRCPHCDAEFTFQRPDGTAAEVVAPDGSKMNRPSVSDTGVVRILGDFTSPPTQDDGTTRHCSDCGATYPSYVPICYNCNVPLSEPAAPPKASDEPESVDFQTVSSFPFQDVPVRKVMRPRKEIDFLDVNNSLDKILNRARTSTHTHYPVCDGSLEKLLGLVHVEDIVLADESDFAIKKIIRPLEVLPESMQASEALHRLRKSGEPIALVVDEYETVIGIVTVKDVLLKSVKK